MDGMKWGWWWEFYMSTFCKMETWNGTSALSHPPKFSRVTYNHARIWERGKSQRKAKMIVLCLNQNC